MTSGRVGPGNHVEVGETRYSGTKVGCGTTLGVIVFLNRLALVSSDLERVGIDDVACCTDQNVKRLSRAALQTDARRDDFVDRVVGEVDVGSVQGSKIISIYTAN